ncbi:MAG: flagellar protein FliS [Lachnospiraceae bacterium]|nr:flagellar protein FliS [Lachnospiraceae bacterium]
MKLEKKKEYKERIIAANRSELIVIMYEMLFSYMEDVYVALDKDEWVEAKEAINHAEAVVRRLIDDLDFNYDIAKELYPLYDFVLRRFAAAKFKKSAEPVKQAETILRNLYKGMLEMASKDNSPTLMQNREDMYLGLTYGKNSLNEISTGVNKRGFYA